MKHKHCDLIKAWADGAEIQYKIEGGGWVGTNCPSWHRGEHMFRIKPEEKKPVVRWLWATEKGYVSGGLNEEPIGEFTIKLEWSRTEFPE